MNPHKIFIKNSATWLITGAAGFIGSHLTERLLTSNQHVIGIDNLSTGTKANLLEVKANVTNEQWSRFTFYEGSVMDMAFCMNATKGVDYVLHEAAIGSVPKSFEDPIATTNINILGTLNVILASHRNRAKKLVLASSSSVYGDNTEHIKVEQSTGTPLSPYAASKQMNELHGKILSTNLNLPIVALRYFNVFGPRQTTNGPYAAVIPKWIDHMARFKEIVIYGDGATSRDFCFIKNVINANILAALAEPSTMFDCFNVGCGTKYTLNELFIETRKILKLRGIDYGLSPIHRALRPGDICHSQASIEKIHRCLRYVPEIQAKEGLVNTIDWHLERFQNGLC